MTRRRLVVLRTGDAIPEVAKVRGEFLRWIQESVGAAWDGPWQEVDVRRPLPGSLNEPGAGYIITGSASSVTERAPWMVAVQAWLREAVLRDVPVFGICFGHQLLAQALGGEVTRNPRGREIGTVSVTLTEAARRDPLFSVSGDVDAIAVNATHVDIVAEPPREAEILATSPLDDHAAFRVRRAWGVQFHPEIDRDLMRGYLTARRHLLLEEGLPYEAMFAGAADAPHAVALLRRFVAAL